MTNTIISFWLIGKNWMNQFIAPNIREGQPCHQTARTDASCLYMNVTGCDVIHLRFSVVEACCYCNNFVTLCTTFNLHTHDLCSLVCSYCTLLLQYVLQLQLPQLLTSNIQYWSWSLISNPILKHISLTSQTLIIICLSHKFPIVLF